jgi:hypothetical protein
MPMREIANTWLKIWFATEYYAHRLIDEPSGLAVEAKRARRNAVLCVFAPWKVTQPKEGVRS